MLSSVVPVLLAALGLVAAIVAWRAGMVSGEADDANRASLAAARARSAAAINTEGLTTRTTEAFLDYERARRRAAALAEAGQTNQAQLDRQIATAHWFLVDPTYIDRSGVFQPEAHRDALQADAERDQDLAVDRHLTTAEAAYATLGRLVLAGIVLVLALPFLTLAELTRGRLKLGAAVFGAIVLAAGVALAVVA